MTGSTMSNSSSSSSSSSGDLNYSESDLINSTIGDDSIPAPTSVKPSLQPALLQQRRLQEQLDVNGGDEVNRSRSRFDIDIHMDIASPTTHRAAEEVLDLCSPCASPALSPQKSDGKSPFPSSRILGNGSVHASTSMSISEGGQNTPGDPLLTAASTMSAPQPRVGLPASLAKPVVHPAVPGQFSPARQLQIPPPVRAGSSAVDTRVRKAPISFNATPNPSANHDHLDLTYVSLATVAAAMSDPGSDAGHSRRLPQRDFNVRGTAVNIRKFRVTEADGYLVLLSLEEQDDDMHTDRDRDSDVTGMPPRGSVVVPVLVSNDLCVKYLGLAPLAYLSKLKNIGKEEIKALKMSHSLKFRDFRGSFRARLAAPSSAPSGDLGLSGSAGATPAKSSSSSSSSATSQGEEPILLLLDFYD